MGYEYSNDYSNICIDERHGNQEFFLYLNGLEAKHNKQNWLLLSKIGVNTELKWQDFAVLIWRAAFWDGLWLSSER